jgi:hypothetical protein
MVTKTMCLDAINETIAYVKNYGKTTKGKAEYLKFLTGFRVTRNQAIKAKCYECSGYYHDSTDGVKGRDCKIPTCPLYPYMPFRVYGSIKDIEEPELN